MHFSSSRFRFGLRQPAPGKLGIGEDDGRNDDVLERTLLAGDHLNGDARFLCRLVREQHAAGDIADRVEIRVRRTLFMIGD